MKHSIFVLVSILAIAALSACAPQGTPTPSVADLQATAMANAQTQIALTAASIPTATQIPTTPIPTLAPVLPTAIPEQPIVVTLPPPVLTAPAAASPSDSDPCNVLLRTMKGPRVEVTFRNTTKGDVSLYFVIDENAFGCGTGNVSLAPLKSVTVNIPKGCYKFYGWISGSQNSTPAGSRCLKFNQTVSVRNDDLVFNDQ